MFAASKKICILSLMAMLCASGFANEDEDAAAANSAQEEQADGFEAQHRELVRRADTQTQAMAVELVPVVLSIFERSCADCHDTSRARPKGGFGNIMNLAEIREDPDYIVPGEPLESELYLLVVDPEPDFRMPPVDGDHPQLTETEARLVRQWILLGAPASVEPEEPDATVVDEIVEEAGDEIAEAAFDLRKTVAKAHPLLVHFPIALLLAGILAELVRKAGIQRERLAAAAAWCLWLGAIGAIFATISGWLNVSVAGHSDETVFIHRWSGVAVAVVAVLVLLVRCWRGENRKAPQLIALGLMILLLIAITIAGHTGGELVYGEGYFSLF